MYYIDKMLEEKYTAQQPVWCQITKIQSDINNVNCLTLITYVNDENVCELDKKKKKTSKNLQWEGALDRPFTWVPSQLKSQRTG